MSLSIILLLLTVPYPFYTLAPPLLSQRNETRKVMKYQGEISKLVGMLRTSPDQNTQETIEIKLVSIAKRSRQARLQVIKSLISMMDKLAGENIINNEHAWQAASNVLVDIKATEAIEALTRHFDQRMFAVSMTLGGYPPARALYRMGEEAIPTLQRIVVEDEVLMRRNAAGALGLIGGEKAKSVLQAALKLERDAEAIRRIENALTQIDERKRRGT